MLKPRHSARRQAGFKNAQKMAKRVGRDIENGHL